MLFNKNIVFALLASTASADQSLRGRNALTGFGGDGDVPDGPIDGEESPCGELKGCYLWDKTAKTELLLTGNDEYCPQDSPRGWSVRCDTDYPITVDGDGNEVKAVVDEIKFFYDGKSQQDEYDEPRWMNGDSDGDDGGDRWINDVPFLTGDGEKEFFIEGRQWDKACFEKAYTLVPQCSVIPSCPPEPTFAEITGPFEIQATVRYDDVQGSKLQWQRTFDFGNGAGQDNIWLGQWGNRQDMAFGLFQDGRQDLVSAPNSLVNGETATWNVGIDKTGLLWMKKNGVLVASAQGIVPENRARTSKLIGRSNWPWNSVLRGAVVGIDIVNAGETSNGDFLNTPVRLHGAFTVNAIAQVDNLWDRYSQKVFEFGNDQAKDSVWFGQVRKGRDMALSIVKGGVEKRVVAPGAIEKGVQASWSAGVDCAGRMWIRKNCEVVGEAMGHLPDDMIRSNNVVGTSSLPDSGDLDGFVLGLKFEIPQCALGMPTGSPTPSPTSSPTPAHGKPPKAISCTRLRNWVNYSPAVPAGMKIELRSPVDGNILHYVAEGGYRVSVGKNHLKIWNWFKPFYRQEFDLRFVDEDGTAGDWATCSRNTPIGLDLDNSGAVERIEGEFKIDINGDGDIDLLHEWFAPSEGILISMMPFIKDGKVTGQNLFGDMGKKYKDGFEKLGLLDKNTDKIISGLELDGLAIWIDANSNARLDDGELATLEAHGIVGLRTDDDVNYVSSALMSDGSEMYMEDLWFAR